MPHHEPRQHHKRRIDDQRKITDIQVKQILHHCGNAVDAGRCERIGKDEQLIAQTHHHGERNDNGVAFEDPSHGLVQCSHLPSSRACRQFPLASIVHLEKFCKRYCKKYFCMTDAIQIHAEFDGFHVPADGKMKDSAAGNSRQPGRLCEKKPPQVSAAACGERHFSSNSVFL